MNERDLWIALASVDGVGEETFPALIAAFGSAAQTLAAVADGRFDRWREQQKAENGRQPMITDALENLRAAAADPAKRLVAIRELGLWSYTAFEADYPERLRELPNQPVVIHGLGNRAALDGPRTVGVVGTGPANASGSRTCRPDLRPPR
ncbi:MAG: recombination-mediator protein [Chloroflexota bacterium]|nr:recombination-mediator protein [Chloroflexota bacterium]